MASRSAVAFVTLPELPRPRERSKAIGALAETVEQRALCRRYVFSARPFGASAFRVSDLLAFPQFLEPCAIEARRVEKQILAISGVDESKTLVRQFLDRAFCHCYLSFGKVRRD